MSNRVPDARIYESVVVIANTSEAVSNTSGGLVVEGGFSSRKNAYMEGYVQINNVNITPNPDDRIRETYYLQLQTTENTFINLGSVDNDNLYYFTNSRTSAFNANASVQVSNENKYAFFTLNGVLRNDAWSMTSSFTGDITGVTFKINDDTLDENSVGILQYKNESDNLVDIRIRATTNSPSDQIPVTSDMIRNAGSFTPERLLYSSGDDTLTSSSITYSANTNSLTAGNLNLTGELYRDGDLIDFQNLGLTPIWEKSNNDIFYTSGNVGIGTTDPLSSLPGDQYGLEVKGVVLAQSLVSTTSVETLGGVGARQLVISDGFLSPNVVTISSGNLDVSGSITASSLNITGDTILEFTDVKNKLYISDDQTIGGPTQGQYAGDGTRLVLWTGTESQTPYALGIDTATMWYGVPATAKHDWYSGTTKTMTLTSNGRLGINTNSPADTLHITGNSRVTGRVQMGNDNRRVHLGLDRIGFGPDVSNFYVINHDGNFNYQAGVRLANGSTSWSAQSDIRFKKNIIDIDMGLQELLQLRPVRFNYNYQDDMEIPKNLGFIAQEVREIISDIIVGDETENDSLAIEETKMIPVVVKSIQELNNQLQTVKTFLSQKYPGEI